jgi:prevent-host-death family protein
MAEDWSTSGGAGAIGAGFRLAPPARACGPGRTPVKDKRVASGDNLAKIANMAKQISATNAKNNFGGLLEDVATLGRVDVVRHGRVVAVVLSPRALAALEAQKEQRTERGPSWGATHMIPSELARGARILNEPDDFDED